jgi:hypothetical protein
LLNEYVPGVVKYKTFRSPSEPGTIVNSPLSVIWKYAPSAHDLATE